MPDDPTDYWPITDEDRRAVLDSLMTIINSNDWPLALRASRIILLMEDQNYRFDAAVDRRIRARLGKLKVTG